MVLLLRRKWAFIKESDSENYEILPSIAVLGIVDGPSPLARTFMEKGDMIYLFGNPAPLVKRKRVGKIAGIGAKT